MNNMNRLRMLLTGLAAGDSLGATSEFAFRARVLEIYHDHAAKGWPFRQVGGNGWEPGQPTDDTEMAMRIVQGFRARGRIEGIDVAMRFVEWMLTGPRDIGGTTYRGLERVERGVHWHEGGLKDYQRNPGNAANGSLMRNGVIAGMTQNLDEAFRWTVYHSLCTHYGPLPMLCCGAQTWLLSLILDGAHPLADAHNGEWRTHFQRAWEDWLTWEKDPIVKAWREEVADGYDRAWETLMQADFDPDSFNPYTVEIGHSNRGYCLLTLQIAIWAAHWSMRDRAFAHPDGYPAEVFRRRGPYVLGWVVMIGEDADTYGAAAGPLIAAIHGGIPEEMTEGLWILKDALFTEEAEA